MKLKKLTAILASTTLAAMLLAGCGSGDDKTTDDGTKTEDSSSTKDKTTEEDKTAEKDKTSEIEAYTGATETDKPEDLVAALSATGGWIFAATGDITLSDDLIVSGDFYNKNDGKELYRKLALYTQDADRNVTGEFTLTVPTIVINSPNFNLVNGTVAGNVIVAAEGFQSSAKIEGNLTFLSQELMDSAEITGEVTGTQAVGSLKDGDYSVKFDGADTKGYTAYAKMKVEGGKITSAEYDYLSEDGTKKSENAEYNKSMKEKSGTSPDVYTKELAQALVDSQNSADVDVVTGATHSHENFVDFASRLIAAAIDGKTDEIVVPQTDK